MGLRRIDGGAVGTAIVVLSLAAGCHPTSGRSADAVVDVASPTTGPTARSAGVCSAAGYCWENPVPAGGFLNAVWGSDSNNGYAAGDGGRVLHFDGASWKIEATGSEAWINGLWGSGPDDVYAVADAGVVLHRKGGAWSKIDVGTEAFLEAAWGTGPDDVYLVGTSGTIQHFDGREWSEEKSYTYAHFQAIWGSGPNDVYAVGYDGAESDGVVAHYDGASWSEQKLGKWLCGVWGAGPEDVWIAGGDDRNNVSLWRLSGSEWKPVRVPKAGRATALSGISGKPVLLGLLGLAEDNNIQFGKDIVFALEEKDGLFQRRDLLTVSTPIGQPNWEIWGDGKDAAFVAGWWGVAGKLDGRGFHPQTGNAALGRNLTGVAGTSPTDVVTVGAGGTMLHYDGKAWSADPEGKNHDFTGIHAANGTLVATARGGIMIERKKGRWTPIETGTPDDLWGVWASGDESFAVGARGTIVRCQAGRCAAMASGTKNDLWSIWGKSSNEIYVTGEKGTLLGWDGASWKLHAVPNNEGIAAIGPDGEGGALAMSFNTTYRLERGTWKRAAEGGGWTISDGSDGEIRSVYGGGGAPIGVRRWDGKKWQEEALALGPYSETAARLLGIWSSGGEVFLVGDGGTILHKRP